MLFFTLSFRTKHNLYLVTHMATANMVRMDVNHGQCKDKEDEEDEPAICEDGEDEEDEPAVPLGSSCRAESAQPSPAPRIRAASLRTPVLPAPPQAASGHNCSPRPNLGKSGLRTQANPGQTQPIFRL